MPADGTSAESAPLRQQVALGSRSYEILIGEGLLNRAGDAIAALGKSKTLAVVTDQNVAKHHLPPLEQSLIAAGFAPETLILPPGEGTKCFAELERLCGALLDMGLERNGLIVALGGGVIGDLAGFAAAILLRGIDYVQIPTTLLAQVDSSVGGKTAIDMPQGKNLVGAFHQPRLVLADSGTLNTLPERELKAGYAEVVKYGLIDRPDFFDWLCAHGEAVLDGDAAARRHAIAISCQAKAEIVARDERESGARALLNLGHTFAHGLEAEVGYDGSLLHGEAVALGMVLAFQLSCEKGLCPWSDLDRLLVHYDQVGLPKSLADLGLADVDPERVLKHMGKDKKVKDGSLTFILTRGVGQAFITQDVLQEEVLAALAACRSSAPLAERRVDA